MHKGPWSSQEPNKSSVVDRDALISAIAEMSILDVVEIISAIETKEEEDSMRMLWLGKKDKMPQNSRRHFQTNPDGTFAYPVPDRKKGHRKHGK